MQRHIPNENKTTIPPNLLKNFNPYDILEPKKNGAKNSDATKVDKLIDIDDCSKDSGFQDMDLHASFLDKNRDFDLIDLYQNIFVSPQHIKMKETASLCDDNVDNNTNFTESKAFDVGFKHFFDTLESGQKIDWTNIGQTKHETESDFIEKKPRVLVPNLKVLAESDSDSDPEELVHEVLAQKRVENIALGNIRQLPTRDFDSSKKISNSNKIPEYSRSNLNSIIKHSNYDNGSNENLSQASNFKTYPVNSQINNTLSTFTVRAIQKDEKVYKKKRIITPEHLKANYTKGPDFYEKSIVLPQIMARLNARLDDLDEKTNQEKILILDAGIKPENEQFKRKSESTSINKDVIKITPSSSGLNSFKETSESIKMKPATVGSTSVQKDPIKIAPSSSGLSSNKSHTPIKEPKLCINKLTRTIAVHTTDKPCINCSEPPKKTDPAASLETDRDFGKLSPVVLMADCNKERLKALKKSQMFKDFVLKGKYEL